MPDMRDDVAAYIAYRAASDWSPRSVRHYRHLLGRLADAMAERGHRRWATVTGVDLDAWMQGLVTRRLSRNTRDAAAHAARRFGAWLLANGKVLRDPAADLRVLDDDEVDLPPAPLSEEQVAAIVALVPRESVVDLRQRLHLDLLYACGLRNAEAVGLDLADLDLDARTVHVRDGKGGRARILPLLAGTLTSAAEYITLRRELLRGPDTGALLLDRRGKRLPPWFMQQWLARASRELGFRVHPHALRHAIAVHLLRRGADVRHIQQFLGHSSLETTQVYLRLVPGDLRVAYDAAMPSFPTEPRSPDVVDAASTRPA